MVTEGYMFTKKEYKTIYKNLYTLIKNYGLYYYDKPFFLPLNSMNYFPSCCLNCLKSVSSSNNLQIINSHSISCSWINFDSDNSGKIFTVYHDFTDFPHNDFSKKDIIPLFIKNRSKKDIKKYESIVDEKNYYSNNIIKYLPIKYHIRIDQNIFIKKDDIFKYYLFSTYKMYCNSCDSSLFKNIDHINNISDFSNKKTISLIIRRFSEFFIYRQHNYRYTLEHYIYNLSIHNKTLKKRLSETLNYEEIIASFNEQKDILSKNNNLTDGKKLSSYFSIINNEQILNKIYNSNNSTAITTIYKLTLKILENELKLIQRKPKIFSINYDKAILLKNIALNNYQKDGYLQLLSNINSNFIENNALLLDHQLKEYKVIYSFNVYEDNSLIGFSYFNYHNILSKLQKNQTNDHDIGFCFLTPKINQKKQFIVYGTEDLKLKLEALMMELDLVFLISNINITKKIFFSFIFFHENSHLNIYSFNESSINKYIDFINLNWDDKIHLNIEDIEFIIDYFKQKPLLI